MEQELDFMKAALDMFGFDDAYAILGQGGEGALSQFTELASQLQDGMRAQLQLGNQREANRLGMQSAAALVISMQLKAGPKSVEYLYGYVLNEKARRKLIMDTAATRPSSEA